MRVLLVEDDEMIGRSLKQALEGAGWSADWVRDGELAQSALADGDYTCVLVGRRGGRRGGARGGGAAVRGARRGRGARARAAVGHRPRRLAPRGPAPKGRPGGPPPHPPRSS